MLTLHARVTDPDNQELYFCSGGIQPAIEVKLFPRPFQPAWEMKSLEEMLASEAGSRLAVLLAVGRLLAVGPGPGK